MANEFKIGEGVIGQVALQRTPIELRNIKKEELAVDSGLLSQAPLLTYTFPLIYQETLYGIIELGFNENLQPKVYEFLSAIGKILATAIATAKQNEKVVELLDVAQIANNQLQEKQKSIEEANALMEEQQQQLKISEQDLLIKNETLNSAKAELEKKAHELEVSGKYKSEFLANMSHELRTPLNSIILLSSLLTKNSKNNLSQDDVKKSKTIFESGNELLRLINDILDLSKVESGKMQLVIDHFYSGDLLSQMKDMFEHSASDRGLDFNIVDNYKEHITSDKDRIAQIIRNLVSNALKFTKQGSITLQIDRNENSELPIKISVKDTGIGIPKNKQEIIFKAFMQADGSTSREYGGTGLGLSISLELSKLLGGNISLTSKEEEGSIFSVQLPNLKSSEKIDKKPHIEQTQTTKAKVISKPTTSTIQDDRRKITNKDDAFLIIDDDVAFCDVVYEKIKEHGDFGLIANDGESGLELIEKFNIKGVLLDLTLPDMDGIEILKNLKSNIHTKHIPVHIISSKDKNSYTLELGALGYNQKPILDGEINQILEQIDSFQQKKIKDLLIVEDDKIQREALAELVGEGVNITGVGSSKEAIAKIKQGDFDAVVVDLGLTQGSGLEVCEFIKNNYPELPIIIYTGRELDDASKKKLQEYSSSIIIKTAHSNERILNEINLFLHRSKEDTTQNSSTKEIQSNINLEGLTILIADDDIKNIYVLDSALKEFNANVVSAFNGREAIEKIKADSSIDLVLMDIMMPEMNGYEAIETIRNDDSIKNIPIIAVTAKAMKEDRQKCLDVGADDYLAKPIDFNALGMIVKAWSSKKSR